MRFMWWAAGVGVALALLLAGAVAVWGRWDTFPWRQSETQHQTFDRPITTLVFEDFRSADIVVSAGEAGRVQVERELRWNATKPAVTEAWDGEKLTVSHDCRGRCSIRYTITVPASVALQVDSTSGDVRVGGIAGETRVKSSSGDVTVTGAAGALSLTTTLGDMRLEDLRSPRVEARVTSGDVEMDFAQAPQSVSVRTTSGDVTARMPDDHTAYKVDVTTTSGDHRITVDQSRDAERAITVNATSGDVTIGYR